MSRRTRLALFALAGPVLIVVLILAFRGLPAFGNYVGIYGRAGQRRRAQHSSCH